MVTSRMIIHCIMVVLLSSRAIGQVVEFTELSDWEAAVGDYVTLDFTGFAPGTTLTDQYQEEFGALFTNVDFIDGPQCFTYPNDCFGLDGAANDIMIEFDQPIQWIAADYPGDLRFELFSEGASFYTSSEFGVGGAGNFAGLVSIQPFDAVFIDDPTDEIGGAFVDDLHFGPPIPAPGALGLMAIGFTTWFGRRRDRRRSAAVTRA